MSRDPHKGTASTGPGTEGLVREGMLDRLLRRLVRPRVEAPLERVQLTSGGDMDLRWAPGRVNYAFYNQTLNRLEVPVNGGRTWLPSGAPADLPNTTLNINNPFLGATYWLYLDRTIGDLWASTVRPTGHLELATIQTPTSGLWPTATTLKGFVAEYDDLHGVASRTAGDCWVTLLDRTTYVWTGTAWRLLLKVTDRRPNLMGPWVRRAEYYVPILMDAAGHLIPAATSNQLVFGAGVSFTPNTWETYNVTWRFEAIPVPDGNALNTGSVSVSVLNSPTVLATLTQTQRGNYNLLSTSVTMPTGVGSAPLTLKVTNTSPTYEGRLHLARLIATYT